MENNTAHPRDGGREKTLSSYIETFEYASNFSFCFKIGFFDFSVSINEKTTSKGGVKNR